MLTPDQIKQYRTQYGLDTGVRIPTKEERTSIWENMNASPLVESIKADYSERADRVGEILKRKDSSMLEKGVQVFGQGAGAAAGAIEKTAEQIPGVKQAFGAIGEGIKWLSTSDYSPAKWLGEKIGQSEALQELTTLYDTDQNFKDSVDAVANIARLGGDVQMASDALNLTKNITTKLADKTKGILPPDGGAGAIAGAREAVSTAIEKAKTTLFGKPSTIKTIDDVINTADESLKPSAIRGTAEQGTAVAGLKERWAGISNDIKNRIAGKADRLKEYFDVAHARNNYDTLPTPLEYGAKNVEKAVSEMERILSEKGGEIGSFRNKISTYEANIDQVSTIEKRFTDELNKLNLEIVDGIIRKKPGTITRVASDSEIGVLNDLYSELRTFKQNPSLEKAIDLRNRFDRKINFEKETRDISNTLDPLSKSVRKIIADEAANIVGKSEAANLSKYSDFIEALYSLKSFTDRKAGSEFLLKQALSERGRVPREVMNVIKEYTGIDLMDDAAMATLATDLIGNTRQKGLFRQEITKAGLDTAAALTGDPSGLVNIINNVLKKTLLDEEKIYLEAAEQGLKGKGVIPQITKGETQLFRGGKGFGGGSFTTSENIAKDFAKNRGGSVTGYILKPNTKIVDYKDVPGIKFKDLSESSIDRYIVLSGKSRLDFMEGILEEEFSKATEWAKENGFAAIRFPTEGEIRIIDKNAVRVK